MEKVFITVNGVRQGMLIQAADGRKPVLLYLHGGIPDVFLIQKYPTGLETLFTVAWWEQRGCGLSSGRNTAASITTDVLIADAFAVTDHLRERFAQDRIYLMGHSGGTFIGIQAAARSPDRYRAYVGVAQVSSQLRSEIRAYEFMLGEYRRRGDRAMVRKLESAPVTMATGTPQRYLAVRDAAMHRLGIGTMHKMRSIVTGLIWPSFSFREYTLAEKINLWRAKVRLGVSALWDEMLATDLPERVPEVAIPVYFLHGIYDYTCSYPEAKAYFARLTAPRKGFYTFAHSAHSPMFEEPARTRQILHDDVLAGRTDLADPV